MKALYGPTCALICVKCFTYGDSAQPRSWRVRYDLVYNVANTAVPLTLSLSISVI